MRPNNVLVWKTSWLPSSETFVRNQIDAHVRWKMMPVGLSSVASNLNIDDVAILFSSSIFGRMRKKIFTFTRWDPKVEKFFRSRKFELIHAHFGVDATLILPTARRQGIPLVVTFHGYDITSAPLGTRFRERLYTKRLPELFSYASQILAVSQFIANRVIALGAHKEKVTTHYIGIPIESVEIPKNISKEYDIVFVGRFVPVKGIMDLLEAIKLLQSRTTFTPKVAIVGGGAQEVSLRSTSSKLGIDAKFFGFLSPPEVYEIMNKSRIFVGPSRTAPDGASEGLGMVYLEAALAGLPVIAYNHGGVSEAVTNGETGLLAPEGDIPQLSRQIETLLSEPKTAEMMGRQGRKNVIRSFDVLKQTQYLEKIFDKLISC